MKIVIIGPAHPLRGGIANFNEALARALQEQGHEVIIYSFSLQYPKFLFPGKTQFDNGPAPDDLTIKTEINSVNPLNWSRVSKQVKAENPDLAIFRFWLPFMGRCLGTIARKLKKAQIPIIAITDNVIPHESKPGDKWLTQYFVKPFDGFIAMSRAVLEDLNQFTDNKNKLFLPHPIYNIFGNSVSKEGALQTLGWNAEDKHVLFFGLVRKYKGLDLLLEAMGDPRLAEMNVKVIVAGEFYDDEKIYHDQIDKLGIKDRVILRNEYIPAEEVKNYFCASDLIAQTYRTATQSGVTQIAYHFERPMLVTDVGGLAEIVPDGKVGYATAVDPKAIADALVDFYENAREQQFTANTVLEKERFTWTKFVDGVTELYQTIQNS